MMNELPKTQELIRAMVEAVDIPITAKMRLGWDDQNLTAPDLARALEDAGVSAIFVHGRTRAQGFEGVVNLEGIRKVVEAVKEIPVIGNGDVTTPEAAKHMIEKTGCHGVSAGRGAFYNPWIFLHTQQYLDSGILPPEPSFEERIRVMCRHYDLMVEVFGEDRGSLQFRKVAPWYSKRFGPVKAFNTAVVRKSVPERILNGSFLNILNGEPNSLMNRRIIPVTKCLPWLPPSCWKKRSINPNREKRLVYPKAPLKSGKSD